MQWVLSHATDSLHYWLLQEQSHTRSIIFNHHRQSLRLAGRSKRLFFLEVQGLLHKKIVLRSEYGVTIAETAFAEKPQAGQLLCNGQKFFYSADNNSMHVFDSNKQLIGSSSTDPDAELERQEFYSLLFGFTWFLTTESIVENTAVLTGTA